MPGSGRRRFLCTCCAAAGFVAGAVAEPRPLGIQALADRAWLHTSWGRFGGVAAPSNGLLVEGQARCVLLDTCWTEADTARLLDHAAAMGLRPGLLVVTHAHEDRMAGLAIAEARGWRSLALAETVQRARATGLGEIREAWDGARPRRIELGGGEAVELFHPGPGHAPDNIVAWLTGPRLLYGGCLLRAGEARDLGNAADADARAWRDSARAVALRYPEPRLVVPGHGAPGHAGLLAHTIDLAERAARG